MSKTQIALGVNNKKIYKLALILLSTKWQCFVVKYVRI